MKQKCHVDERFLTDWQLPVQPLLKISRKWRHSRFRMINKDTPKPVRTSYRVYFVNSSGKHEGEISIACCIVNLHDNVNLLDNVTIPQLVVTHVLDDQFTVIIGTAARMLIRPANANNLFQLNMTHTHIQKNRSEVTYINVIYSFSRKKIWIVLLFYDYRVL